LSAFVAGHVPASEEPPNQRDWPPASVSIPTPFWLSIAHGAPESNFRTGALNCSGQPFKAADGTQRAGISHDFSTILPPIRKGSVINGLYRIQGSIIKLHMSGSDKRRWFRSSPRGLVPRTGKLLLGPKTTPIDCHVLDLSAGGACLELSKTYSFPQRFEFLHGSTRRFCTIAWTRGFRIGISYEGTIQRSSVSGGLSRPKSGASLLSRNR
jgi:hypothetical protein